MVKNYLNNNQFILLNLTEPFLPLGLCVKGIKGV